MYVWERDEFFDVCVFYLFSFLVIVLVASVYLLSSLDTFCCHFQTGKLVLVGMNKDYFTLS